ncbi:ABC transporter substrate-binding protein [uncultured Bifidobacterium sp.]|uniref:ABC transporter substrate-binding protein n=1 Tax=uncultured Bifidobacterium sp. TaxID=165187 RepID=UPI0028DC29B1|nr:ABC transporter substrate-binding protein [uncultured Bifidobacterium sp.]
MGSLDDSLAARERPPRRRRRWPWVALAALLVVAVVVSLLVVRTRRSSSSTALADTVSIGLKLAPTNLDIRNQSGSALDQVLIGNVYQGLVGRNSDNTVIPSLATSWTTSSDGRTYVFRLRHGVTFSNGDRLDADDVVWSIRQLVSRQYVDASLLRNFSSIEAVDAHTVRIVLTKPYADLLWVLAGRPGLVFDKDADYDARTSAVGSGPYVVSSFRSGTSITLKANTRYTGKDTPRTRTIVLRYYTDDNAAVNALKSGTVQILAPVSQNLASTFSKDTARYTVKVGDGTDKYVLAFNGKGKATSDRRVRQALRYAIDSDELIAARGGVDKALGGPIPSLDPGYADLTGLYPHDEAKARTLLAEAGYDADHPLTLTLTYANVYGTEIGRQLKTQLARVGVTLTVNVVEFATWLQNVYTNHDYDLSLVDHNESHDFYQWTDADYYYGYDNATVQSLYGQAMASTDAATTDRLLRKAARLVSEDAPADWLFNYRISTAWAKGVTGFPTNLNQTLMPLWKVAYRME